MKILNLVNSNKTVLVSDGDLPHLSKYNWSITKDGYVQTAIGGRGVGIGQVILGFPKGIVDHKDGNTLNNMRSNLRVCTPSQSNMNRRGWAKKKIPFKGVHFDRARNKYRAILTKEGTRYQSARFDDAIDAARAYDRLARKYHGWFARTNFL